MFGYISKNFLKNIFWCLEKKKEKTNQTNPEEGRRDRTAIVEIGIDGAITPLVNRCRRRSRSIATSGDDRRSRSTSALVGRSHRSLIAPLVDRRACSSDDHAARRSVLSDLGSLFSLSLSLSFFPEMNWSENEGVNSFPGQRRKFWSTGRWFPENFIFRCNQTCGFGWKWFPEIIFTQNKRNLIISIVHKYKSQVTSYYCTLANCSSYGWFNGTNGPRPSLLLQRKILVFKTKDPSHVWIFSKIMILAGYCGSGLLLHKTTIKKNVLWGSPFHVLVWIWKSLSPKKFWYRNGPITNQSI